MTTEQTGGFIIAVSFSLFCGYMIGLDHAKTEQELKARLTRPVLPNKCLCGLDERAIRNITWKHCKGVKS